MTERGDRGWTLFTRASSVIAVIGAAPALISAILSVVLVTLFWLTGHWIVALLVLLFGWPAAEAALYWRSKRWEQTSSDPQSSTQSVPLVPQHQFFPTPPFVANLPPMVDGRTMSASAFGPEGDLLGVFRAELLPPTTPRPPDPTIPELVEVVAEGGRLFDDFEVFARALVSSIQNPGEVVDPDHPLMTEARLLAPLNRWSGMVDRRVGDLYNGTELASMQSQPVADTPPFFALLSKGGRQGWLGGRRRLDWLRTKMVTG